VTTTQNPFDDLSLKKQLVYRRYANGELSGSQVWQGIENLQPPIPNLSWKQKVAFIASTFFLLLFIPPWAKRD
jgi:hypothetical protein